MPGTTIGINMTYGYPGQASRHGDEVSRTRAVAVDSADIPFGAPVIQKDDGSVALFGADDTATDFAVSPCARLRRQKYIRIRILVIMSPANRVTSFSAAAFPPFVHGARQKLAVRYMSARR